MSRIALITGGMAAGRSHLHQDGRAGLSGRHHLFARQQDVERVADSMKQQGHNFKAYPCDVAGF